jgi:hypothetical protein
MRNWKGSFFVGMDMSAPHCADIDTTNMFFLFDLKIIFCGVKRAVLCPSFPDSDL